MLASGYEKQKYLYRGYGNARSCTPRAAPADIFARTFAEARALRGAPAPSRQTTKRAGCVFGGDWCESSGCGVWVSRRLDVRTTRLFDGRSLGQAPKGRPADRYRVWP